jgi:acetyl-CoA synthetase
MKGEVIVSDYASAYADFSLSAAYSVLSGGGKRPLNAAIECCDRWCGDGRIALRWASEDGRRSEHSFEDLRAASSRMAHLLVSLGVGPGDRVGGLLPRTPDLLTTILATWRIGAVYQPLFTAFGPKPIEHRLLTSQAKVVVTDPGNRGKLQGLENLATIVVTQPCVNGLETDVNLAEQLPLRSTDFEPVLRSLDDPFLMMFTSGTTGPAKPLLVPLKAIAAFVGYMRDAVDLRPDDRFWNIADPGWAYGLYYAVTGPLAMGHATLLFNGAFSVQNAVRIIRELEITNLAGAPTAFRLLVAAGVEPLRPIVGKLRAVSSAGEALNPEVGRWFAENLKVRILDHYGQTELGMVVCNHHALTHPLTPGSAGFPVPGHRVVVLDDEGTEVPPHVPGTLSVDALRSPLFWFAGYEGRGQARVDRYYRSGDVVERNEDGSISFVGRADDVITSSGYRIGPFEVESALIEHPAVAEAAVIGKPDPQRTEIVKAFVVLNKGRGGSPALALELQEHVKLRLSAHSYPREVEFVDELPKTPSGKIQRFLLREQEKNRITPRTA